MGRAARANRTCLDCSKPAAKRKVRCSSCDYAHEKLVRPYETAYRVWRNSVAARARKAPPERRYQYRFEVTFEEFKAFAEPVELLKGRGITATSLHIDRKEEELGYIASNLQPLSNVDNVLKEHERRKKKLHYDYQTKTGYYAEVKPYVPDPNVPF